MVEKIATLQNGGVNEVEHLDEEEDHSKMVNDNSQLVNSEDVRVDLGDYCLVGWDLDTTGRRLLDEIVHIAGYTADDSFSLYVMPHGDLSMKAGRRHMIRIVSVGLYRVIRDNITNRPLKTKSEISAITDFLEWLEQVCKKSGKSGVLLMSHENYKFNPHLFIKSLEEFNLLDRFKNVVKGFVDCHKFARNKCEKTMVIFTMRILSKVLLDKDSVDLFKASDRARLTYEIVQHLCAGDSEIGTGAALASPTENIIKSLLPFSMTVDAERDVLNQMRATISKQDTFKPVFGYSLRFSAPFPERRTALQFRRYLVDAGIEYDTLKTIWAEKAKEGIEEIIKDLSTTIPEKDYEELLKLLVNHFENPNPPKPRYSRPPFRNFRGRRGHREQRRNHEGEGNHDEPKDDGDENPAESTNNNDGVPQPPVVVVN